MPNELNPLSHGRLMNRFNKLGPYLRHQKSSETTYFFDCLSACVDAKKAPERREFWGWWFELSPKDTGFEYTYTFGKFNSAGDWVNESLPKDQVDEVKRTLDVFYGKLNEYLGDEMEQAITPNQNLKSPALA